MSSPEGEGAEGQVGHREEIYYHRDTEGTEFRRNPNFRKSDAVRFRFLKSKTHPFPKLRVLCVSVVINSPAVFSCPHLYALTYTEGTEFKTETNQWFRISVFRISPKLRVLCVSVVINFPSVLSCPSPRSPLSALSLRPGLGGTFEGSSASGRFLDQDA
jgi:hypothetical protein